MGIDYYGVLNIKKCSSKPVIKKAYRRLALLLHPAKASEKQEEERNAFVTFSMIGEAYDVLSNDLHRAVYDQYGEEGLKTGVPGPRQYIQPYVYHGDPSRTFQEFFGSENPFADLLDVLIHPLSLYVVENHIGVKKKSPDVYHPLPLRLDEVYYGGLKQVLIRKQELSTTIQGEPTITRNIEILKTIYFGPGIYPGTEFRFTEAGNQAPDIIPADVIFVTEDKPHEIFKREGGEPLQTEKSPALDQQNTRSHFEILIGKFSDKISIDNDTCKMPTPMPHLSMVISITLSQALTGFKAKVETVDGRTLQIPITDIVSPSYEKIIVREGLPIYGDEDGLKGELRIRFDIQFPIYPFPSRSRLSLKQTLPSTISKDREFDDTIVDKKMKEI